MYVLLCNNYYYLDLISHLPQSFLPHGKFDMCQYGDQCTHYPNCMIVDSQAEKNTQLKSEVVCPY